VSVVYDTGVLVAAERNDRQVWADHRVRLEVGAIPVMTAPVVAQVSRSSRQAQLRRFLRGCDIVSFVSDEAHEVGVLLGKSDTADVVDAHVVITAARINASVLTSDPDDLRGLSEHLPVSIRVQQI
jgi:hypothetical protein